MQMCAAALRQPWTHLWRGIVAAIAARRRKSTHARAVAAMRVVQSRAYWAYHARLMTGDVLSPAERADFVALAEVIRPDHGCACS